MNGKEGSVLFKVNQSSKKSYLGGPFMHAFITRGCTFLTVIRLVWRHCCPCGRRYLGMAPLGTFFWNPITELIFAGTGALKLFVVAAGILKYSS